jgi:hypothetical protein
VTHLDEKLSLEKLFTIKIVKSLICLVGTQIPTVSIIEQQLILSLETLTQNKTEISSGIKCSEVQIIQNWIISTRKTRL